MKIALLGYGKMGKTIEALALKNSNHSIPLKISSKNVEDLNTKNLQKCDVAIEFSNPENVISNIENCFEAKIPIVVGTTGWNKKLNEIKNLCTKKDASILYASNFSIGVNLFFKLNKYLAKLMENYTDYDLQIDETHHTTKKDAPSGTAITLATHIIESNKNYESWQLKNTSDKNIVGINALRIEDVKGKHTISYKNKIDEIEITHSAFNRNGFALGALKAAEFLKDKKGVFTMEDVLRY